MKEIVNENKSDKEIEFVLRNEMILWSDVSEKKI